MPVPDVDVFLDDGTGTFPYDVSAYVLLVEGLSNSRGREDQFASINPGSLDLTFDNSDGRFTLGHATYDIAVSQKIRVKVNTVTRFTGYVHRWPVKWVGGPGKVSHARVTATDQWARLNGWELRSLIEEEILNGDAVAYYTLGDPSGSTQAADSSGNLVTSLSMTGSGTAVVFGNATGPATDGLTAAQFANGQYLSATLSTGLGGVRDIRATVLLDSYPASSSDLIRLSPTIGDSIFIRVNSSGAVVAGVGGTTVTSSALSTGTTHDVSFSAGVGTSTLYVDGVSVGTAGGVATVADMITISAGSGLSGVLSHLAVESRVTPANAWNAVNGHTSSTAYMTRIAAVTGTTVGTLDTGLTTPHAGSIDGMTAAAALQRIADAEVGVVYISGTGALEFRNRNTRPLNTAADWTINTATSELVSPETEVVTDAQDIINYATAKAEPSNLTQTYKDQDSIDAHGRYKQDYTYAVTTDAEALYRAQWIVGANADPQPRMPDLTLDLMTATSGEATSALALEIGSRIQLTGLPSQAPDTTVDLLVEGWTETISLDEWTLALNVTDWAPNAAWVLGDSTYSVLGSTTKLYV